VLAKEEKQKKGAIPGNKNWKRTRMIHVEERRGEANKNVDSEMQMFFLSLSFPWLGLAWLGSAGPGLAAQMGRISSFSAKRTWKKCLHADAGNNARKSSIIPNNGFLSLSLWPITLDIDFHSGAKSNTHSPVLPLLLSLLLLDVNSPFPPSLLAKNAFPTPLRLHLAANPS